MFDAIQFAGYKSFLPDEEVDILDIGYLNLFIGKNNCGKSSALDVIGASADPKVYGAVPSPPIRIIKGYKISSDLVDKAFASRGYYSNSAYIGAKKHIGEYLWVDLKVRDSFSGDSVLFEHSLNKALNKDIQESMVDWQQYCKEIPKAIPVFLKVGAERNIVAEQAANTINLKPDGTGATNLVRRIVNHQRFDESLIESELLDALNSIMGNDAHFENIRVQETEINKGSTETKWEIYLQESGNKRFPLSQSGSGLKTIILVLLNLLVLPKIDNKKYIYGFEELENNLHPALQRRLYDYIYRYAIENQTHIFMTTHSHVAINMFFGKEAVSIYHVVKSGKASVIKRIETYLDKVEILDDLDVKASDLLQSNGVIWVEGPSDRIYVKRWLEVFGGTDIEEGLDFQFAYYGGRLLSHYTTDEECQDLINVLLINRNSAIIMDSDKRARNSSINETKKRIEKEFTDKNLFSWITKGKEIENYISVSAIKQMLESAPQQQCEPYQLFPEYIEPYYGAFKSKKVPFANEVKDYIDDTDVLDLAIKIRKLYQTIKAWNK